jgi:hypothetical protein
MTSGPDITELRHIKPQFVRGADGDYIKPTKALKRREVNLATWRPHIPKNLRKALDHLDLEALAERSQRLELFWHVLHHQFEIGKGKLKAPKSLRKDLRVVFNDAALCKEFADYITNRVEEFARATGKKSVVMELHILHPQAENYVMMHADKKKYRGLQSLKAKVGTIVSVKPPSLAKINPFSYPEYDLKNFEQIAPDEFGIMKGLDSDYPLNHGTPPGNIEAGKRFLLMME